MDILSFKEVLAATIMSVTEATDSIGIKSYTFKAVLVEEGITRNKKRHYTKEALKEGAQKFVGAKMFLNHQVETEKTNRPERSIEDEVAVITKSWYEESNGNGRIMGDFVVHGSPTLEADKIATWIRRRKESGSPVELSLNGYLYAESGKTEAGGFINYIKKFEAIESVDFVTVGNAYGKVKESFGILTDIEEGGPGSGNHGHGGLPGQHGGSAPAGGGGSGLSATLKSGSTDNLKKAAASLTEQKTQIAKGLLKSKGSFASRSIEGELLKKIDSQLEDIGKELRARATRKAEPRYKNMYQKTMSGESLKKGGGVMKEELLKLLEGIDAGITVSVLSMFEKVTEAAVTVDEQIAVLKAKIAELEAEKKAKETESKREKLLVEAQAVVTESKLPTPAKEKVTEALKGLPVTEKTESLKDEAIKLVESEKAYIEKFAGVKVFAHGEGSIEIKESVEGLLAKL